MRLFALLLIACAAPATLAQETALRPLTMEEARRVGLDSLIVWSDSVRVVDVAGRYDSRTSRSLPGRQGVILYPAGLAVGCSGWCAGTWRVDGNLLTLTELPGQGGVTLLGEGQYVFEEHQYYVVGTRLERPSQTTVTDPGAPPAPVHLLLPASIVWRMVTHGSLSEDQIQAVWEAVVQTVPWPEAFD